MFARGLVTRGTSDQLSRPSLDGEEGLKRCSRSGLGPQSLCLPQLVPPARRWVPTPLRSDAPGRGTRLTAGALLSLLPALSLSVSSNVLSTTWRSWICSFLHISHPALSASSCSWHFSGATGPAHPSSCRASALCPSPISRLPQVCRKPS